MKYLRPKLWILLVLLIPLGLLINHFRPLRPAEAIRAAWSVVEKEYPDLAFDPGTALATWLEPGSGSNGLWMVHFYGPYWYVIINVTPDGKAAGPCWFPKTAIERPGPSR